MRPLRHYPIAKVPIVLGLVVAVLALGIGWGLGTVSAPGTDPVPASQAATPAPTAESFLSGSEASVKPKKRALRATHRKPRRAHRRRHHRKVAPKPKPAAAAPAATATPAPTAAPAKTPAAKPAPKPKPKPKPPVTFDDSG